MIEMIHKFDKLCIYPNAIREWHKSERVGNRKSTSYRECYTKARSSMCKIGNEVALDNWIFRQKYPSLFKLLINRKD